MRVNEWVSHVFIRKRTVVIGIYTNFKWPNSGVGAWGFYNQGFSLLGTGSIFQGSVGILEDTMVSFIYMSLISWLESKKWRQECIKIVLECLGILPKNEGEALVSGFGSEQPLQQQSMHSCFVRLVCSLVFLWNISFLSVQSSLVVPAWLWTTTLQYNYSTSDNISKCFNI